MLDHILKTVQSFKNTHDKPPDVIYINPSHYEGICEFYPELFSPPLDIKFGFRLVIVPASTLIHPEAAQLSAARQIGRVA